MNSFTLTALLLFVVHAVIILVYSWWSNRQVHKQLAEMQRQRDAVRPEPLTGPVDDLNHLTPGQVMTFVQNIQRNAERNRELRCLEQGKVDWNREGF